MSSPTNPGRGSRFVLEDLDWIELQQVKSKKFKCFFCDSEIASDKGYRLAGEVSLNTSWGIYICPNCESPTFFNRYDQQIPRPLFGNSLSFLPKDVEELFDEARMCYAINAFTSSVTICRTILGFVATDKGAKIGQTFQYYVDYLYDEGWIPRGVYDCIDEIRKLGNDATHYLRIMEEKEAKLILLFSSVLLKNIYELPSLLDDGHSLGILGTAKKPPKNSPN